MILLAQAASQAPSSSELGTWLYAAATVAQLAVSIVVLVTINSKQRREISFAGDPVDRKDFQAHVDATEAKIVRIHERIDHFEDKVGAKLDAVATAVAAISGELNAAKKN